MYAVFGMALPMNLFTSRMFAKVPLAITASLPRREPYELNSLGVNLRRDSQVNVITTEEGKQRKFIYTFVKLV